MENLLKIDWEKEYINYIQELDFTDLNFKNQFLSLLQSQDAIEREKLWSNLCIRIDCIKETSMIANPYFIGFGNPASDILFLGKEKAFDIVNNPNLFIKESINNIIQWKKIYNNKDIIDHKGIYNELGFNPMFPRLFHNRKMRKNHTWGKYSEIVAGLKNNLDLQSIFNETIEFENSFFYHCFISEINYVPSRYSKGKKLIEIRKKLLKNDFYKNFSKIIIGALGYLEPYEIMEVFNLKGSGKEIYLGENKSRKIKALKFKEDDKTIIYCNQLSGAAGWTNKSILKLIDEIK